ncbi:MAG: ferritin family protein [Candidatus Cloacimonetes bacterium]|nr:ferritin family protein [Candidatus Cloacimonadota bacterium]MCF7815185.1 ferritin family protein [Candidatus Cloacimonadota bacterium]MCF7867861.1 ferritin family protein [Candidatus Cloacimonadota bacterium]MCF7884285.1 ferritin family protein [Candidatus Cloacimonadota bacterium]
MESRKEVYQLVIQEEIKAQNLYKTLAKALNKTDSEDIFEKLIKIEKIHEEKIIELFNNEFPQQELNIDRNLTPKVENDIDLESPEKALRFAISKEEDAQQIYLELASGAENLKNKELFEKFAADERNHKKLLEDEISRLGGLMTWFDESELNGLMEY